MANRFPLIVDSVNLNIKELPSGDNLDLTGSDALFGDNDKAIFGADSDLQIYHAGSNSIIAESGAGSLILRGTNTSIQDSSSVNMIQALSGGAVTLYHNSAPKLATTSTGIDVTGTVTADSATVVTSGALSTIAIGDQATGTYGQLLLHGGNGKYNFSLGAQFNVNNAFEITPSTVAGGTTFSTPALVVNSSGNVGINNSAPTTALDVTGTVTADGLTVDSNSTTGAVKIQSGDTNTFGGGRAQIAFGYNATDDYQHFVRTAHDVNASGNKLELLLSDGTQNNTITSGSNRVISFAGNGDISFYNSAGTSQDFYWDASTSRLGLGVTNPSTILDIREEKTGGSTGIRIYNTDNSDTTTQTASLFLAPDSRGNGALIFGEKENASFATTASRDVSLVFSPVLNNTQTRAMTITSAGHVGIGTTAPSGALHVYNGSAGEQYISSSNSAMRFVSTGGANYIQSGTATSSSSAADLIFTNVGGSGETMRIDSAGNVGIGTSSPSSYYATQLVVNGGTDGGITVVNTTTGDGRLMFADGTSGSDQYTGQIFYNHASNYMAFGTNGGTERMRIDSNGTAMFKGGTTNNAIQIWESNSEIARIGGSSGTLNFLVGSTTESRMAIDANGNVGIGTTSPAYSLDVTGSSATIHVDNTAGSPDQILQLWQADMGTNDRGIQLKSPLTDSNADFFRFATGNSIAFEIDGVNALSIAANKRIGIGTDVPATALEVKSSAGVQIRASNGSATFDILNDSTNSQLLSSGPMFYRTNGTGEHIFQQSGGSSEAMRIDANGNVGIGTSAAATRLFVYDSTTSKGITCQTDVDASPTTIDDEEFISFAAITADANLTFSGSDARLMTGAVTPDNTVVWRAQNIGLLSTDSVKFFTAGGAERMRIDASGNVAIGQQSNTGGNVKLDLHNSGNSVGTQIAFYNDHNTGGYFIGQAGNTTGNIIYYNVANTNQEFYNNNDLKMTLDASGNLLVGKTAIGATTDGFEARASGFTAMSDTSGAALNVNRNGTDGDMVFFYKSGTTVGSIGSRSGVVSYIVLDPRSGLKGAALIGGSIDANEGVINPGKNDGDIADAAISFGTSSSRFKDLYLSGAVKFGSQDALATDGTSNYIKSGSAIYFQPANSTKMLLDASGNFFVGTTSQINSCKTNILGTSTTNVLGLKTEHANYLINGFSSTTEVFRVASTGNVTNLNNSYGSLSDERLKSNIVDAPSQLDDIMAVQVRSYTLNSTGETHIGVVAQELEASGMSGLVEEDKEGMKSVKYSVLYMKAIKALQEQNELINDLRARVAQLEGAN